MIAEVALSSSHYRVERQELHTHTHSLSQAAHSMEDLWWKDFPFKIW